MTAETSYLRLVPSIDLNRQNRWMLKKKSFKWVLLLSQGFGLGGYVKYHHAPKFFDTWEEARQWAIDVERFAQMPEGILSGSEFGQWVEFARWAYEEV